MTKIANRMLFPLFGLLTFVAFFSSIGSVYADEDARMRQQLEQYRSLYQAEQSRDVRGATAADLRQIAQWIENAEILIAKSSEEAADLVLKRIEIGLDMVRAEATAAEMRFRAEEMEQQYHAAQEEIEELKAEIDELENKIRVTRKRLR